MSEQGSERILLIEDDPPLARVYQEYLRDEPYEVVHLDTGKKAMRALDEGEPIAIILDVQLPDINGLEVLKHVIERGFKSAVIVITAHGSINMAVDAMREGAADFVMKPFNAERLIFTLRNALERRQLKGIVESLREDLDRREFCGFIGKSLAMQGVYRIIDSAAPSKATVFITGESGTGKEVCAEAIHVQSPRKSRPFIALNCGAIPKELMESEIFGHVKGAFTGAHGNRDGAATLADGGTLFLDEICEMDMALQVKLLRFIQTGGFQKVGSSSMEKVDVRFVCATNKDPWQEVEAGRFREDLYYRLHVIPIHLPPLKDREDDVVDIAEQFLVNFANEEGKGFNGFADTALDRLTNFPWPGNVRQLQNVIRNIVVLHDGALVEEAMLPPPVGPHPSQVQAQVADVRAEHMGRPGNGAARAENNEPVAVRSEATGEIVIRPMWQVERDMINNAIEACDGNVSRAAALLEMSPSTIYRRLREAEEKKAEI